MEILRKDRFYFSEPAGVKLYVTLATEHSPYTNIALYFPGALMYRLVHSADKGSILIADRDFLPGAIVIPSEPVILKYTEQFLLKFERYKPYHKAVAAFNIFINDMSTENRKRLLSLYGPTTGFYAESLRRFFIQSKDIEVSIENATYTDQVETMVKVGSVSRLNVFHSEKNYLLFDTASRISHSCLPNCEIDIDGSMCICRALLPIKAGEELTIEYNDELKLKYVYMRRRHYLASKEFTCHCPRCDAPGDDTRQFDCFDPTCKGVMMVCQPVSKDAPQCNSMVYTGVEYMEPHLLPCTVCHRTAPSDYQTEMLTLETQLPRWSMQLEAGLNNMDIEKSRALLERIAHTRLPRRHSAALPLLQIFCILERNQADSVVPRQLDKLTHAVQEYVAALDGILTFPNSTTCKEIVTVVTYCCQGLHEFPPAVGLLRRALRIHLITSGRDTRDSHIDQLLLSLLKHHYYNNNTAEAKAIATGEGSCGNGTKNEAKLEVCAFCEESPLCAALTLSRCGRCRQVAYCSVGCQKAHWKLHKKTCKS